jgi:hypothetical protein
MSIKIENSDFYGSPVVVGDDNNVLINFHSKQEINWEMLQDNLIETSAKLPKSSKEYDATKKALSCAMAKDEKGLVNTLKNNLLSFSSDLFKSVASGVLIEYISSFIS